MYVKKSLGQHFLRSERALTTIRDGADPKGDDIVLEIGPGEGVLTKILLAFAGKVVAVEKDDQLFESLKQKFSNEIESKKLDLVHGDILEFDPNLLKFYRDFTYKLVANIPYNITGAILEKFLSADYQPERIVLLVQKEVAERVVAKGAKESILSISVKVYGKPKYIETVKAGSFVPAPKVDSAILLIEGISKDFFAKFSEVAFFKLLRTGFGSKRKKLSSNLAKIYPKLEILNTFELLGLNENSRAEDVSPETWQKLAEKLCV
ncbi:16S rRNA (adenine(1518)-N(6)/adenine(1519)-N(6))-dimethyltransferase RsmA [Candidatus Parcubacteria bacterium]|nr:16S rRNA (adenine(1518)-N(6)/adenine(1519)-N(6))-dimethyltransferase RsmA [Candidatus Parcubacteria bacterium]